MEGTVSYVFNDIDHFREKLRGWDTPAIQIESGVISLLLNCIDLDGIILSDISVDKKVIDHSRIEDEWYSFIVALSPSIFCGMEVDAGHITVLSPGREYRSILSSNWRSIEIVALASVLADEGLNLAPHLVAGPETSAISLPEELVHFFRRLTEAAFGGQGENPSHRIWLRRAVLHALDKALTIANGREALFAGPRINGYNLVQRLIRYIESRFGQPITVNEIARDLNVTPRALNYATRSVFDMSPFHLAQAFRLNNVRNELWERRLSEPSITPAALMQGFSHLGRFSQQYHALFGELPSQTLQRIKSLDD